jgi:hypothetical protein
VSRSPQYCVFSLHVAKSQAADFLQHQQKPVQVDYQERVNLIGHSFRLCPHWWQRLKPAALSGSLELLERMGFQKNGFTRVAGAGAKGV